MNITGLSFKEKSLILMFVSLLAVFGFYFMTVLPHTTQNVLPNQVVVFGVAVALLVVMQIVGHILIVLADRQTGTDERDRIIELKGARCASFVLATAVFSALCVALLTEGNFVFTHVLLGGWVLSHLVEIGFQLFLYRRES